MASNVQPTGVFTPEVMGLIHARLATALGVSRAQVKVVHWAGKPASAELWTADEWGHPLQHLGDFTPDPGDEDPYACAAIAEAAMPS